MVFGLSDQILRIRFDGFGLYRSDFGGWNLSVGFCVIGLCGSDFTDRIARVGIFRLDFDGQISLVLDFAGFLISLIFG